MASDGSSLLRKSDRTRESILDAARIAFARKGFSGVTIRDITDLADVNRAGFYYYFSDKTELFIELGTETYRQVLEVAEAFGDLPIPPSRGELAEWVEGYFSYLDRNGAFVNRSTDDMPTDPVFRAAVARSRRRTATTLGERIVKMSPSAVDVDPAATGLVVMAMLEQSWQMVRHNDIASMSRSTVLAAATDLLWRALD
ncbi:TetR/AcrR family transcriptional regulator [Mycolicibacterium hodleri]|uniref:TetR/AcrR family transcriptional regulator n=1 Tax=Mycolicibacterium hodleri TaxID=49897 RepID=A0A502EGZ6_9MYCO|nr:TetR/AcrR family transcriptional regulator [Mycolicibacterium hodleri]TPG36434.1 TetR/AcrR family transcriptional regulator [Mycolicibacterium hodleri]